MSQFNIVSVDAGDFVKKVKFELSLVNKSFFEIGRLLCDAQDKRYYIALGYPTIVDCSEALFGLKKTLTYDLINVYRNFSIAGEIDLNVKHLPQSHLIALLPCQAGRSSLGAIIQATDKVEDVKRAVKVYNRLSIKQRSTFKSENLKDFLEEYDYPGSSSVVRSGSSAQAENKVIKSSVPDLPLYDLWSDISDVDAIKLHLENAISELSLCFQECNVGSSFRNDVIKAHNDLKLLLDRFIH